jgi:hypothetical protein
LEQKARALTEQHGNREPALKVEFPGLSDAMIGIVDQTLPLVRNRSPLLTEQARWLGRLASTKYVEGGVAAWVELPKWIAWCIAHACGAYALCTDELEGVNALLAASVDYRIPGVTPMPLASIRPGHASQVAGELVGGDWACPWFEQWSQTLSGDSHLRGSVPELYEGDEHAPREWLLAYNLLATAFSGHRGEYAAAPWTAYVSGGVAFTERLHRDDAYLDRVARVIFQCEPEAFRASAASWLAVGLGRGRSGGSYLRSRANLKFE